MANSSDWIAALGVSAANPGKVPGWIAAEGALKGFNDASPFARLEAQHNGPLEPARPAGPAPEPAQPSATERAFGEGFAEGHAQGFSEAEAAANREMAHLRDLRLAFRTLDASALDVLSGELAATVLALCGQVLGEHAADPAALAARCHAAAARLGDAPGRFALHLHPLDIAALEDAALAGLEVKGDPGVARGGLRLAGPDSELHDGPEEWLRAIASALGVDRFQVAS